MSTSLNLNYTSSNRAVLTIPKLTDTTFTINNFKIPSIRLPAAIQHTPFAAVPWMGDKVEYDDLKLEIIINEDITNWIELHDWLRNLGAPEDKAEFRTKAVEFVDAFVVIYNSHNNPILKVTFQNTVITDLEGIDFNESISEADVKKVEATFKYERYDITRK